MNIQRIRILKTVAFNEWYQRQPIKTQLIIDARLQRIEIDGHWGTINCFDNLIELKWKSGIRIYTHFVTGGMVIILLGGNKNGQSKDIKKAQRLLAQVLRKVEID
ncbi:MAG: hypothetical protein HYV97_18600 [Bdellovibrio sp.]|nr:hypothetical protein [Bdellovibrio sp.]